MADFSQECFFVIKKKVSDPIVWKNNLSFSRTKSKNYQKTKIVFIELFRKMKASMKDIPVYFDSDFGGNKIKTFDST